MQENDAEQNRHYRIEHEQVLQVGRGLWLPQISPKAAVE